MQMVHCILTRLRGLPRGLLIGTQSFLQVPHFSPTAVTFYLGKNGMERKTVDICMACPLIPRSDPSSRCPSPITNNHPPVPYPL